MTITEQAQEIKIIRAAAYQRISEDKAGDEHGVTNQRADQVRTAQARGYMITLSEADNDISATKGLRRPGYERVMAAAARGDIDVILCFQTSRFWRNRIERAKGIEVLRKAGVSLIATKGPSLDMSTAYGRAMAGLLGEFDTMETDVKSERQQLANEAAAKSGNARGNGHRPFGWQRDRVTADPAESPAVKWAYQSLLADGTIAGIMREWTRLGLRPRQVPFGPLRENQAPLNGWTSTSVRVILKNPRNAGIAVYRGTEVGRGKWEPLVLEEVFRAAVAALDDPSRLNTRGVKSLLGGIALCRCGNYATGGSNTKHVPVYRCNQFNRAGRPGPHVAVQRGLVDTFISKLVVARLSEPDAMDLLPAPTKRDAAPLHTEAQAIRQRMARLTPMFMAGQIEEADVISGKAKGKTRLAEIKAELEELGRESVLAPLLAAENIARAWEELGIDRKRAVVDTLMTVTLHGQGRGVKGFDPDKIISIKWREQR